MPETISAFSKRFDSTLLRADATRHEVEAFIERSIECDVRAIVVPWYLMPRVVRRVAGTTVRAAYGTGFPLGHDTTESKAETARRARELGPGLTDIDITANISAIKSGDWDYFRNEIDVLSQPLADLVCKVIIEVCYLTPREIATACRMLAELPYVDYIKTGTGFGTRATTTEDVKIIREALGDRKGIKVSGGVKTLEEVRQFLAAGADIFGSSSAIAICEQFRRSYPAAVDLDADGVPRPAG
ncbi:MAG: deoxyribose-phosphate aldolase [Spirochaetaceae bacterium]|nr:MAG: deoxyribose-phosphate aldolase [Spirochaetaceae bacterium]